MLEQFSREFYLLYPNAKLLVASKEDFTKEKRKLLTAKVAITACSTPPVYAIMTART